MEVERRISDEMEMQRRIVNNVVHETNLSTIAMSQIG